MHKLNLLLLSPLPPPVGGIAKWTEDFYNFSKERCYLTIVNTALIGSSAYQVGQKRHLVDELVRVLRIIIQIRKYRRDQKPDIIHLNTSCSKLGIFRDYFCVRFVLRKTPFILHCHCNIEDQLGQNRLSYLLFSLLVKKSLMVFVLNASSSSFVKKIRVRGIHICPNFIPSSRIAFKHNINPSIRKIIFVGHVCINKGVEKIFKIANVKTNIQFILIGKVSKEIEDLKRPSNILLAGELCPIKVQEKLDEADLFLFPSISEGFSLAMLEAMSRGLPIIATDVGANREMIEDKGGIIISKKNNINEILKAVETLENRDLRETMASWNLQKVKDFYAQDKVIGNIFSLYEESINGVKN